MGKSNLAESTQDSPLRVAILSDSAIQRAALKHLLKTQGSQIVHEDTLGAYHPNDLAEPTDVLLVDLKSAGEMSLKKLDDIIDDTRLPVLFNDGETIPTEEGPIRDDWINNLTYKLFTLANKPVYKKPKKLKKEPQTKSSIDFVSDKPASSVLKKDFPKTIIISKSKTRRNVLQNVLIHQGLTKVVIISFDDFNLTEALKTSDILLLDQHNISHEDYRVYKLIKKQTKLGYILCDSSKLPLRSKERLALGTNLIKKLTSKATRFKHERGLKNKQSAKGPVSSTTDQRESEQSDSSTSKTPESTVSESRLEHIDIPGSPLFRKNPSHWADRLSDALAGVRRNLRSIEGTKIDLKRENKPSADSKMKRKAFVSKRSVNKNTAPKKKRSSFFIEPIIKKVIQAAPIKNLKQNNNENDSQDSLPDNNTQKSNDPAILDIYSDMIEAVKQIPAESEDTTKSLFMALEDESNSSTASKNTLYLSEKAPVQSEEDTSAHATMEKSAHQNNLLDGSPIDLEFSSDSLSDLDQYSSDNALDFDIELGSLGENMDIFEDDAEDLSKYMDADTENNKKGRKFFGIDWSNPFG